MSLLGGARSPAVPSAVLPPGRGGGDERSSEIAEAAQRERRRALLSGGRGSTFLDGQFGAGAGARRKTLLGE